jgi:putative ABC transport system substrate-binding protein
MRLPRKDYKTPQGGAAFLRREPSSLLKEAVPQITRLGFLDTRNARERAKAIEREIELKNSFSIVGPALEQPFDEQEYQRAFAALAQEGAEDSSWPTTENVRHRILIAELAAKGHLPTIYPFRQFVEVGGLMAYGINLSEIRHRVADLADKILKGAKPGDIPIFQPTKFELSINLKTAKALGIELPPLLVARADNVIE